MFYKCKYFKLQELVSPKVYKKYGEKAWQFLDADVLMGLDAIREHFSKSITINNWLWGGGFTQRGLRSNKDSWVKKQKGLYCSDHCFGRAFDFDVKGISAAEVRTEIKKNEDKFKKYFNTVEETLKGKPITWVHIGKRNIDYDGIYFFNA